MTHSPSPLPAPMARTDTAPAAEKADLLSHDAPAITTARAAELAQDIYGITGTVSTLSAEKDANFRVQLDDGAQVLLKVTNAAEDRGVTDMQTAALMHLALIDPTLPVPRVHQTLAGAASDVISGPTGQTHVVRLLSFLEGTVLSSAEAGDDMHRDAGALQARLLRGLRGFFHPAAGHFLQWDIKQAHRLRPMLGAVADDALRARLTTLLDLFDDDIAPRLPGLRAQVVHNDFNPHNLLVDGPRARRITGIIDFGDMVHTALACDLAVACSYQIAAGPDSLAQINRMIAGFHAVTPLEPEELALLPDLIRLRHATTLCVGSWRAQRYPENAAYILRNADASRRGLAALDRIGTDRAIESFRAATERQEGSAT